MGSGSVSLFSPATAERPTQAVEYVEGAVGFRHRMVRRAGYFLLAGGAGALVPPPEFRERSVKWTRRSSRFQSWHGRRGDGSVISLQTRDNLVRFGAKSLPSVTYALVSEGGPRHHQPDRGRPGKGRIR
jgi:hypothetical protein